MTELEKQYRVKAGARLKLADYDPADKSQTANDKAARNAQVAALAPQLDALQDLLYAEGKRKVLVVLQGMDTSGKDGTIRKVFQNVDPLGVRVQAFKAPTETELAHDYLWRIHQVVPRNGELVIFNRSHYEDVLVTRVKGWIDQAETERRIGHINDFERLLSETGTTIIKFFLHISKDEQRKRFLARIDEPEKNWKFSAADIEERKYWDDYQVAFEECLEATSTKENPWYIVPADKKENTHLILSQIILDTMKQMKP